MSKMGQYVFDVMMAEEASFYGYTDRKGRTDAEADEDTRSSASGDGSRRFVRGANQRWGSDGGSRPEATDFPMATGSTPDEILRRS
jgi:hypothetical protein